MNKMKSEWNMFIVSQVYFPASAKIFSYYDYFFLYSLCLCLCLEGHETKAMLNNRGPRYKRSKIEQRMNIDIFFCVGLLFIMCLTGAVGMGK